MKTISLIIFCVLLGGGILFAIWKILAHKRGLKRQIDRLEAKIKPIRDELKAGRIPAKDTIETLASSPQTRSALFECLREAKKMELFPEKYNNQKALAESDLCYWLSGPGQLGDYPDEIEFVKEIELDSGTAAGRVTYYLVKFRKKGQHWSNGRWMAGVAGPYQPGQPPRAKAPGVYSSMLSFDEQSPEKHVENSHHILKQKNVYAGMVAVKSTKQTPSPAATPKPAQPPAAAQPKPPATKPAIPTAVAGIPAKPAQPAPVMIPVPVVPTPAATAAPVIAVPRIVQPLPAAPTPVRATPPAAAPVAPVQRIAQSPAPQAAAPAPAPIKAMPPLPAPPPAPAQPEPPKKV